MPLALIGSFFSIFFLTDQGWLYELIMRVELVFVLLALAGYAVRNAETKIKALFIPYYFLYMHYCVVFGWIKYFRGKQQVTWEKAKRAVPLQQVQTLN